MKIQYIFLLSLLLIIPLNAMDFDEETEESSWFQECPVQETFTCNYFKKKSYWPRAFLLPQKRKEALFRRLNHDDEDYENVRCKIAGWVCAGVDPNLELEEGQYLRVLGRTVDNDDFPVTELLLENKTDPNKKVDTNFFALFFARNKKMAQLLIDRGASSRVRGIYDTSLLHFAVFRPDISSDLVDFYIDENVSVLETNLFNATALHDLTRMCEAHTEDSIKKKFRSLLRAGINLDHEDITGETALDKVAKKKYDESCRKLYDAILKEKLQRQMFRRTNA